MSSTLSCYWTDKQLILCQWGLRLSIRAWGVCPLSVPFDERVSTAWCSIHIPIQSSPNNFKPFLLQVPSLFDAGVSIRRWDLYHSRDTIISFRSVVPLAYVQIYRVGEILDAACLTSSDVNFLQRFLLNFQMHSLDDQNEAVLGSYDFWDSRVKPNVEWYLSQISSYSWALFLLKPHLTPTVPKRSDVYCRACQVVLLFVACSRV